MAFNLNLGNYADQLSLGEVNGALRNVGSDYQIPEAPGPMAAPDDGGAQAPVPAMNAAAQSGPGYTPPSSEPVTTEPTGTGFGDTITNAPLKDVVNLQNLGTLVGGYFGGPVGAQIGGAVGGMAKRNVDANQRQQGGSAPHLGAALDRAQGMFKAFGGGG